MGAQLHQLVRDDLGMVDELGLGEHRSARHLVFVQPLEPLRGRALLEDRLGLLEALHHVDGPVVRGREELVHEPVRPLERGAESLPLGVRDRPHRDVPVARSVDEVRGEARTGLRQLAVDDGEVYEPFRPEERDHRVQHRKSHVLAFAGPLAMQEGGGNRLGGGERGHLVGDDGADHHRPAGIAIRLDVGKAAQGLDHRVVDALVAVGAAFSEPADRDIDDVGTKRPDGVLSDPHPLHRPRPKVLDEHVGRRHQTVEQLPAGIALEVQHDRFLAPVRAHEGARDAADVVSHPAHDIAGGRLDLDDLGTLVGKHHGRDGTGDHGRQVHDPEAGERSGHLDVLLIPGGGTMQSRSGPKYAGPRSAAARRSRRAGGADPRDQRWFLSPSASGQGSR